jgi:hypothetical protein
MCDLSSTIPGPVRAPIANFSGFYRIVEPKCRIVRVFLVCPDVVLRRRILFILWESIGQYQQRFGLGNGIWHPGELFVQGKAVISIPRSPPPPKWLRGMSPTEPAGGPDFPFFEVLQDSRARMQDSKDVFGVLRH